MLVTVILGLAVARKEFAALLTMAACCLGAVAAVRFLEPVLDLLQEVEAVASLTDGILAIVVKCAGIALVAELAELVCKDAGSGSLGKMIQILSGAVIVYLSVPVVTTLLNLVQEILGAI